MTFSTVATTTLKRTIEQWFRRASLPVFFILAVAACGGSDGDSSAEDSVSTTGLSTPTTSSDPVTATTSPPTTTSLATTTTTRPEPESNIPVGEVFTGEAEFLNVVEPSIALTAETPWKLFELQRGVALLQDPELVSQFTRGVVLVDAVPIREDTIDDWAQLSNDISIQSRTETDVGGVEAVVYDITYDGDADLPILSLASRFNQGRIIVRSSEYYRIWDVNTGDERRLFIFAAVLHDDIEWLEKAENLVSTIELGG